MNGAAIRSTDRHKDMLYAIIIFISLGGAVLMGIIGYKLLKKYL